MTSRELANLVAAGHLAEERPTPGEIAGHQRSGEAQLRDAENEMLSIDSRFNLAYGAAHHLSLAALRRMGLRSENRYVVFQALPHTLDIANEQWRVLAKAHGLRNRTDYEGSFEVDERLVKDMIAAASAVRDALARILEREPVDPRL